MDVALSVKEARALIAVCGNRSIANFVNSHLTTYASDVDSAVQALIRALDPEKAQQAKQADDRGAGKRIADQTDAIGMRLRQIMAAQEQHKQAGQHCDTCDDGGWVTKRGKGASGFEVCWNCGNPNNHDSP